LSRWRLGEFTPLPHKVRLTLTLSRSIRSSREWEAARHDSDMKMKQTALPSRLFAPTAGSRRSRRGFPLVEMFIVGALIALFAGLAIFNIREQFESNRRKATIGEARQLGTALGFAKMDVGVFPKLCFLMMSERQLQFEAVSRGQVEDFYFTRMDYTSIGTNLFAAGIKENWRGPYFAASQSRTGIAQGRGGFVSIRIPDLPGTGDQQVFKWPADSYGNPWVVYLVSLDRATNRPVFINGLSNFSPMLDPDYLTAVVSYGSNRMPGGGPSADPALSGATLALGLYTGDFRTGQFTLLTDTDYAGAAGAARAAAISTRFGTNGLAVNDNGVPTGILDAGSDDIIYEF